VTITAPPARRASGAALHRTVLGNGLRVVIAPDASSPLVAVAVVYDVGFRSEPEGSTGFAHLFEHMMFQGSANVAKVEHVRILEGAGGVFNGHTRADITAYYEALPRGGLELALFLEADRMRSLAVNEENLQNQISVVKEEIKVNVLNQPYGGFPWIVLPELAFDLYPNSHNGYGDFADLERSTVEAAVEFYGRYYAPSNAVIVVAGDCDAVETVELVERHFDDIPARPVPPHGPWPERPLEEERRRAVPDPRAPQPAFAIGLRVPDPAFDLDGYLAHMVVASVLADGEASRLRARLVHRDRLVTDVSCSIGVFGDDGLFMRDPVLFQIVVQHAGTAPTRAITKVIDDELRRLGSDGPSPDELERVAALYAADYWRGVDSVLNRSVTLACLEVIQGRAELAGELPELLAGVPAERVAEAAAALADQHKAIVEIKPSAPKGRR
jgi:zinc protease